MRLSELTRYHIPSSLIDGWRARQGEGLLPLQSEALRQGLLADESEGELQSLLISGPTSTGKTFCAELALAGAIVRRRKGVLLVPLKSIAEEKFAEFEALYRSLNLKCIIATADHPEYDADLQSGNFDIAVCVYEKFNRALLAKIDLLGSLGALVIDEAQLLTDPERGVVLESILLKLFGYRRAGDSTSKDAVSSPRLIALTAALASDRELAQRLGARLVRETRRPVELRLGVLFDGVYRYFNRDTGEIGADEGEPRGEVDFLERLRSESERPRAERGPQLVFLNTRNQVRASAMELASCSNWPRAAKTLEALVGEEPSSVVRSLCQTLGSGVAFHSSDLTAYQRSVVERGFRSGEIAVIFCTTTLALGVNLPAQTVYIEPSQYTSGVVGNFETGQRSCAVNLVPLPRADFENIAGRAGRYGCQIESESSKSATRPATRPVARAVLLAQSEFERDVLWENYIEPSKRSDAELVLVVDSALAGSAQGSDRFASLALELIVCGLAPTVGALVGGIGALANSQAEGSGSNHSGQSCATALVSCVGRLVKLGLIDSEYLGKDEALSTPSALSTLSVLSTPLGATALGRAAAISGLSLASVAHLTGALERIQPTNADEWLALALSSPDFLVSGSGVGRSAAGAVARELFVSMPDRADRLLACFAGGNVVESPVSVVGSSQMREPRLVICIRSFLILKIWRSGERAHFLETRCRMSVAQVSQLASSALWVLHGLSEIATVTGALGVESDVATNLKSLMSSLRYGLPASALGLGESVSQKGDGGRYPITDLFNRAELMELDRRDCSTAFDVLSLLGGSGAKALGGASINPASALKVKERRLQERLAERDSIHGQENNSNTIIHSNKKERVMSEPLSQSLSQDMSGAVEASEMGPVYPVSSGSLLVDSRAKIVAPRTGPMGVPSLGLVPCSLHIDGSTSGERFLLRVDGVPVALTGKSFKYLVKLVCARLSQVEGWIYKDDIEVGFNQARYLYRMRREIEPQLPGYRWAVYENNRLGYYRLALDAAALDLNREALVKGPDYEVAQAVAAVAALPALAEVMPVETSAESRRLG